MSTKLLDLVNITKSYDGVTILDDLNLYIRENEFLTLLGPSGCGKTTTLRILGGFETPDAGKVLFNGQDITQLPPNKRQLNTVFQKYALFTHMTIAENIAFGLKIKRKSKAYIDDKIKYALKLVENRSPALLSGGQQQRIAIARAIVNEPKVLLLDEPLGALDLKLRQDMQYELIRLKNELGITFVYVTHDQEEAMSITDEIVLMRQGVVQQVAGAHEMYMDPANSFVASFMGNPPISYVDVQVGGGSAVLENGLRLPCRSDYAGHAKMGIRPEAWALGGDLSVTLTDVEMRGQDQVVSFTLAGQPVRAILNAEEYVRPGQEVHLRLSEKRCYLFNPETGVRL